jgi:glycosyltransferase involved in cell wall biosynthesis
MSKHPFSIVILTLNEEQNLPGCLASTAGCDDVVVLDSGSTDRTVEIARAAGARVFVNPFRNFAQQRNYAHDSISFHHDWVFHLDADETLSPKLIVECTNCITAPEAAQLDGFYAAPRMMFRGRWIPRCTDYPAWQARFVHVSRFRFVEVGHGQREAPGLRLDRLHEAYEHNLSSHGEADIRAKHARYALTEAATFVATGRPAAVLWRALRNRDPLVRRRALKEVSYYLPARGVLRFIYQYILRRGFLDGTPGLAYCLLLAHYEQAISTEIRRLRLKKNQSGV